MSSVPKSLTSTAQLLSRRSCSKRFFSSVGFMSSGTADNGEVVIGSLPWPPFSAQLN